MTYNILVVDDSKLARMAVAKALNSLQPEWNRVEATNADEALELVREGSIDLALMDFNMPGRDGLRLAAELRQLDADMPLALISANQQQEIVKRAGEVGATFLAKPLTEHALREFIDDAVLRLKARSR